MLYAISDRLLERLKTFVATCTSEDNSESAVLLQDLATIEADPILTSLFWTKLDLVAEFRALLHGASPRNADGTFFDKTVAFGDPIHERIANEMAGNVDEFCLGIRNDVNTEIAMAAVDALRNAVLEELDSTGIDIYTSQIPSASLIADHFAQISPELLTAGFQTCVRHVAREIEAALSKVGEDGI